MVETENILELGFLPRYLRTPQFAAICVGFTAFFNPGLWGSINGLGSSGISDASVSNAASAIIFGTLAVCGFITPIISNRIGVKQTLLIGTLFYSPYAGALYFTARHPDNKWFLPFSAFLLGVSAAHLWVASGSILLGYPPSNQKGKSMSTKISLQNIGGLVGSAITLGMNHVKTSKKTVASSTFLVLVGLIVCGIPFALILPTPRQIIRKDNQKVVIVKQPNILKELKVLGKILKNWRVITLLPLLLYNQWWLSYQAVFNAAYFNVRGRALNSFLSHLLAAIASWIAGIILDNPKLSIPKRGKIGFVLFYFFGLVLWILLTVVQYKWRHNTETYDWGKFGAFIYSLWGFVDGSINTLLYWFIGNLTNNVNELTILSGVINGVGSLGSAMAFAIAAKSVKETVQGGINAGLFFFSIPFFAYLIWTLEEKPVFDHGEILDVNSAISEEFIETDSKNEISVRVSGV